MQKTNHHLVSQFYLRLFAADRNRVLSDEQPRQIHLYNLNRRCPFLWAALRKQCYKRHFHGHDDKVEDALGHMEALVAPAIKRVVQSSQLPKHGGDDHDLLLLFVMFQMTRTAREAERTNEMIDKVSKQAASHDPRFQDADWNSIRIGVENPVFVGLQMAPLLFPYLRDLRMCLICSPHATFLTSDNPVCKYNLLYEWLKGMSMMGVMCRGLQVFVPLSPHHVLLLLDRDSYTLRNSINNVVSPSNTDVTQINGLQIVNAQSNVYFGDEELIAQVEQDVRRFAKWRVSEAVYVEELPEAEPGSDTRRSSLIHAYDQRLNLELSLSFLKISKEAQRISQRESLNVKYRHRPTSVNPLDPHRMDVRIAEASSCQKQTRKKLYIKKSS